MNTYSCKHTISEMNILLGEIHSKLDTAEENCNEHGDRVIETVQKKRGKH